jgi:hypothetical protein
MTLDEMAAGLGRPGVRALQLASPAAEVGRGGSRRRELYLVVLSYFLIGLVLLASFQLGILSVGQHKAQPEIVSPFPILPNTSLKNPFQFIPFYNATTVGTESLSIGFQLNVTSQIRGGFSSIGGIDMFILPAGSSLFFSTIYSGLRSAMGYTYSTGAAMNGTVDVTLGAGDWQLFLMDPSNVNSTLTINPGIQALATG